MRQDVHICRKPGDTVQRCSIQPAGFSVLVQLQLPARNAALEALHAQVKSRVIPLHRVQQIPHLHLQPQLLRNFTHHSGLRGFPRLNLTARELPAAAVLALRAFYSQHLPRLIQDEGSHHFHDSRLRIHARDDSTTGSRMQTDTDTAGRFSSLQRRGKSVE